ncbi:MAG: hypothetical protein KOO63_13580 [Bacteroidales bacterium]|nr:hypothetical protein [Candidatus Latescibacterota bacterium]
MKIDRPVILNIQILVSIFLLMLPILSVQLSARPVLELEDGAPVSIGTIRKIHSEALGDERTLLVSLPENYAGTEFRYPVLYLLYGDQVKGYFAETVHHIHRLASMGAIPELIIVGVANVERYRDLRPVATRGLSSRIDQFIEFVREEMIPFIDSEYKTKDFRILVGPQAGAVFGLYVLTGESDLFDAYILNNPFEADNCREILMERAESFFGADLPAYTCLQISCVTKTLNRELTEAVESARRFAEMTSRLAPGNLDLNMIYIDDNEDFIPSPNQKDGLKNLFADYKFPEDRKVDRLKDFTSHYDALSAKLGFDVGYPELPMVFKAVDLNRRGRTVEAVEMLEFLLEENPRSLNGLWQLANIKRGQGERDDAIKLFRRCLEIMPNMTPAREMLNSLEAE